MREQDVEIGPNTKMRLGVYVAITTVLLAPIVAILVKVEQMNVRMERIENHITTDWNLGHQILWAAKLADANRTNGFIVPDPEATKRLIP